MGLVNCFKSHVCDLANLTEPIRALLKKDTAFIWGPKQQEAVQAINQAKASISDTLCRFSMSLVLREPQAMRVRDVAFEFLNIGIFHQFLSY